MKNQITIREAVTENDAAAFWEQLHAYHKRDIFTDSDKEELEYFRSILLQTIPSVEIRGID